MVGSGQLSWMLLSKGFVRLVSFRFGMSLASVTPSNSTSGSFNTVLVIRS